MMIQHPAYLQTDDAFCDGVMTSLQCDGKTPRSVSLRRISLPRDTGIWSLARTWRASMSFPPGEGMVHRVGAAGRMQALSRQLQDGPVDFLCIWRGLLGRSLMGTYLARSLGVPCAFFERGPLPGWLQIDPNGVNARNSVPRDAAFFRRWRATFEGPQADWRDLRATLQARTPRRALSRQDRREDWSGEGPFLFVPFQLNVANDPLPDAGWAADAGDLVEVLARASLSLPKGWHLRLKPHPNARGDLARLVDRHPNARMVIDRTTNSLDQLKASRGVITVNSAMGIEAFFFDKPVIVLGDSYYGGLGRTELAPSPEALALLLADPDALQFDATARDDLMTFLFNDYFVRDEDLRAGHFTAQDLLARHARHEALAAREEQ
ncbi:hypothetical protein MLD63_01765 (plasmid) [Paracoccus sp. TK19116]|uniref:Capsular biosynthesis protein n=1 Tax=Paracoccus albicereus TaxID=2922394 RepID=A0ABT1MLJ6_9RHOB|nr:hypothetical protein [Paracoccus albicereus]MCQ0969162.1 hypothetical protein [Paracoccus albicereus]